MLRPYRDEDFEILAGWVTGSHMLFQFAGTEFTYPITKDQVAAYRSKYPDRLFYIGYFQNDPCFFGEIIPVEDNIPRLARLLIGDPAQRGNGLGALFVNMLIGECERLFNPEFIDLYVWENNVVAIGCYKKAGFDFIPIAPFKTTHEGIEYNLLKMRICAGERKTQKLPL